MKMIIRTRYYNNVNGKWLQLTVHVSVLYFKNVNDMQDQKYWLGEVIWEGDMDTEQEIDVPAPPTRETYLFRAVAPDGTYTQTDPYPYTEGMIIDLNLFPSRKSVPEPEPTPRVLKPKLTRKEQLEARKKNRKKSED